MSDAVSGRHAIAGDAMRVILFGATGMIGQGVLRECLRADDVDTVVTVGRSESGQHHSKLREIVRPHLDEIDDLDNEMADCDACFFCLGVSSAGMKEEAYTKITYDLTLAIAGSLARLNPRMTFVYVSGASTDASERGRMMWARVKGRTENALRRLPFKAVYLFRPGAIQPLHGIRSKTPLYRALYAAAGPLLTGLHRLVPNLVLTTEGLGQAMLAVARHGAPKAVLESRDLAELAKQAGT